MVKVNFTQSNYNCSHLFVKWHLRMTLVPTNSIGRQMASKLSESLAPDDDSSTLLAHNDNDSHTPGPHILVFFLSYCSYVVTLISQCTYISYMVYIIPKFIESHKITECLNIGLYKIFTSSFNTHEPVHCTGSFL